MSRPRSDWDEELREMALTIANRALKFAVHRDPEKMTFTEKERERAAEVATHIAEDLLNEYPVLSEILERAKSNARAHWFDQQVPTGD